LSRPSENRTVRRSVGDKEKGRINGRGSFRKMTQGKKGEIFGKKRDLR